MRVKALKAFAGNVTMRVGEVKDLPDYLAHDLIRGGLAELDAQEAVIVEKPVQNANPTPKKAVEKKKKK